MIKQLAYGTMVLEPGKIFAVAALPGTGLRVVDGIVWVTTSGRLADVWLEPGDEYRVESRGLTVIESAARSTVELLPPHPTGDAAKTFTEFIWTRSRTMYNHAISIRRVIFAVAACAMSALTMGLAVIAPAQLDPAAAEARMLATAPDAVTQAHRARPMPHVGEGSPAPCVL